MAYPRESNETGDIDRWMIRYDSRKVEIVTLTLPPRATEGWIFYFSGLALMPVSMTGRRMTGRHRRTGTASIIIYSV